MLVHFDDLIAEDGDTLKAKLRLYINDTVFLPNDTIPVDLVVNAVPIIEMKGKILQAELTDGVLTIVTIEPEIRD